MVSIEEIQAAYYMVAATGVLVAAIYYVFNMKATLETRRIGLIENISSRIVDVDGLSSYFELMSYEWKDYEDFDRKYGSENNVSAAAKRFNKWITYNTMGMMLRRGLVDVEDLHDMGLGSLPMFWEKYRPIVEETRRRYMGKNYCRDMEYLAGEMLKYMQSGDPSYRIPEKLDKYGSNK